MVVAEARQTIKFWSPDLKRLAYKTWDEMSIAEQTYLRDNKPELLPAEARPSGTGRYLDVIEEFEFQRNDAKRALKESQNRRDKLMATWALSEYQLALDVLHEAEMIPEGAEAQFAHLTSTAFRTRIPPRHNADERSDDTLLIFSNHILRTNLPHAIAWLRRMIRDGLVPELREVKVGEYPAIARDTGAFIGWVDRTNYMNGVTAGLYAR